jgi:hypothetical protein
VAFHETFWVTAAAAAPVIALANQITLIDSVGVTDTFGHATGSDMPPAVRIAAKRGVRAATKVYAVGYLNLTAQVLVFGSALWALQHGSDGGISMDAVSAVEVGGLAAIGLTAYLSGLIRSLLAELDTEGGTKPRRSRKRDTTKPKDSGN